jgi:predicted AAA+ superfamily ATPase
MLNRIAKILLSNSFFLFGPRGVGKTRFVNQLLDGRATLAIDLLDPDQFDRYSLDPASLLRQLDDLHSAVEWVLIDEVQKVPTLLDVAHKMIEKRGIKFALTGSSARKLRRGSANLLAGRAFTYNLFPFTSLELGESFELTKALEWGTLPKAYLLDTDEERQHYLRTYVQTYIKEEVVAEQLVRKLEPFRRFLPIAAQMNGKILNYAKIAREVGSSIPSIQSYFQILEDTLLGFFLEPYHRSIRKRQREAPKFYFFDTGVQRALMNSLTVPLTESSYAFGDTFEHFVILEIVRRSHYARNDWQFSYLRTKDDAEIDLIIERPGKRPVLVEVKSTSRLRDDHVAGLQRFKNDFERPLLLCLSRDELPQARGEVIGRHWRSGIEQLCNGML